MQVLRCEILLWDGTNEPGRTHQSIETLGTKYLSLYYAKCSEYRARVHNKTEVIVCDTSDIKENREFFCFPRFSGEGSEDDSWESRVRWEQGAFSNEPNKRQKIDRESGNNGS